MSLSCQQTNTRLIGRDAELPLAESRRYPDSFNFVLNLDFRYSGPNLDGLCDWSPDIRAGRRMIVVIRSQDYGTFIHVRHDRHSIFFLHSSFYTLECCINCNCWRSYLNNFPSIDGSTAASAASSNTANFLVEKRGDEYSLRPLFCVEISTTQKWIQPVSNYRFQWLCQSENFSRVQNGVLEMNPNAWDSVLLLDLGYVIMNLQMS